MISTNLHQQTMKSIIMVSYFLLLVLFINIFVVATDDDYVPVYFDSNCTISRNFTSNSPYQFTLASLFVSLSSHLDANTYFYNTTQPIQNTNDTVFVLFMCRRDVPSHVCHDCVQRAATRIARLCPNNKEAIIWYEECMLRYSDRSFFSTLQKHPNTGILFPFNVSNMDKQVLEDTVNDLVEEAAKSKFAIKEANLTETTLYSLAQCTQDLSTQDCHICLRHIIRRLWSRNATVYGNRSGNSFILGLLFNPTCNFMFGPQRFYYKHNVIPITPLRDVQGLEDDRQYLYKYSCPSNKSFTANSDYQSNQRKVLYTLVSYSNATGNMGFYNTTVSGRNPSDTVYGLFMCRGDVSPQICHQCVSNASELLSSECQFSKEAIVWYLSCLLRYSNHSFFSILELDLDPSLKYIYTWDFIHKEQNDFNQQLATTLSKLVEEATDSGLAVEGAKKFAMEDVSSDTMWGMFYTLAQCTPDLSTQDCRKCLTNIVEEIKLCCLGKQSGIFMYPSCNMLFSSSYRFYYKNNTISETPAPTPTHNVSGLATKGKEKGQSRTIIIVVVVVLIVLLTLFGSAYYILRRKRSKRYKALLEENCSQKNRVLHWLERSKIIGGIARGVLYIHEHSRLKAWKQWRGGNWSDILDSDLIELESYNNEVVRCIQIGLLCVQENPVARPSMNTVVQYLSNDSIQLPSPQKPAFFLHGQMEPTNGECAANDCSGSCSINEMSMSNYFFPR
ncbi:cysteine-rich receptor-like protein kinase 10 [Senna tora]|uniref:Cysteine-rich receptor-like protein kinase 10 n=1 Tax=Senna tora TaxID=362788 RepID=A0A835CIT6_9FABA|nr:cysteine-rich receptor-like protein kinase 10 [Senna tora]